MFQSASPQLTRRLVLMSVSSLLMMCAAAGGTVAYLNRCSLLDYLNRAAVSPHNPQHQYVFACGYVWYSVNGGQLWNRINQRGLPVGTRDGFIAFDQKPNTLYLGVLILSRSSIYCLQCAFTNLRPAIYTSADAGQTWAFAYKFRRGPSDNGGFLALRGDPTQAGRVWAVIYNGDEISYYASATSGLFWKKSCTEYYFVSSGGCALPDDVRTSGGPIGE